MAVCGVIAHGYARHVDHITPVRFGGTDEESNLQALCAPCNLAKDACLHGASCSARGNKTVTFFRSE